MGHIVIFKALDQSGLQQFWNAVGPEKIRKSRIVLGRREQHSLRLKHRSRAGFRTRQLSLDGFARWSEVCWSAQVVSDLLSWRAATGHLFKTGEDAVEFSSVPRQALREHLQIGDGALQGFRIFAQHGIDFSQ